LILGANKTGFAIWTSTQFYIEFEILLRKLNQEMLFKPKRAGGDPSGPAAETAHEKRGRAPAGPLRYRCTVFFVLQKRPRTTE